MSLIRAIRLLFLTHDGQYDHEEIAETHEVTNVGQFKVCRVLILWKHASVLKMI